MYKRILTILLAYIPAGFVVASVLLVTLLKWVPVKVTPLMIRRTIENPWCKQNRPTQDWIKLWKVSPAMIDATIAAEDTRFFQHNGFDYYEIRKVTASHHSDWKKLRGCSSISQQTAKNCFTWCTRTWLRKGIETYYTVLIERIWGKERILEVYLNVAEMGTGVYGVEAASHRYFNIPASELTMADASSLACCLPNPRYWSPDWINRHHSARRDEIARAAVRMTPAELSAPI